MLAFRNLEDDSIGYMVEYLEGEESKDLRGLGLIKHSNFIF